VIPQLDDVEAELTYLALRDHRPHTVMELGTFQGWSTTWILRALRDNGHGRLHSFDQVDAVLRTGARRPRRRPVDVRGWATWPPTWRRCRRTSGTSSWTPTTAAGSPAGTSRTSSRWWRRARR
jgi:hypothetical protein